MQASAQAFDDEADFDRTAAETYLRGLRGGPAPRRPAKVVRQVSVSPPEAAPGLSQPNLSPAEQPPRRKTDVRAWVAAAAAAIAIAAPVSLGAGWAYWSGSKPSAPESGAERVQIDRPAAEAYMATTPVAMKTHTRPARPARAGRQHNRRVHPRTEPVVVHRATVEDSSDEIPADFPF